MATKMRIWQIHKMTFNSGHQGLNLHYLVQTHWTVSIVLVLLLCTCVKSTNQCPDPCHCYHRNTLVTCIQSGLHTVPELPSTTLDLRLNNNNLRILYNHSLYASPRIRYLDLRYNLLMRVHIGAFKILRDLHTLLLSNNQLTYLAPGTFLSNGHLNVLDLHSNVITDLSDTVLAPLHSLKILNVSSNRLVTPRLGAGFSYTHAIMELDWSYNQMHTLDRLLFPVTSHWSRDITTSFNLSYCGIRDIRPEAFDGLKYVERVVLSGNAGIPKRNLQAAVTDLQAAGVQHLILSHMGIADVSDMFTSGSLLTLDLSHNAISSLPSRCFYFLNQLRELRLDNNFLTRIPDLNGLGQMQLLDLSHNYLHQLNDNVLDHAQELQVLRVRNNLLTSVSDVALQSLWYLHTLDISNNNISIITINSGLEHLSTLLLSNNSIYSVLFMRTLRNLDHLDLSYNRLGFLPSRMFTRGHHLQMLNLSHNLITTVDSTTFLSSVQVEVDLSHNQLYTLHNPGWRGLISLHLHHNHLKHIDLDTFHGLTNLTRLDLSHNNLTDITSQVLVNVPNLQYLDVSWNPRLASTSMQTSAADGLNPSKQTQREPFIYSVKKLQTLYASGIGFTGEISTQLFSTQTLQHLSMSHNFITDFTVYSQNRLNKLRTLDLSYNRISVPRVPDFKQFRSLKEINLSHNTFWCECEISPFTKWLHMRYNDSVTFIRSEGYMCSNPSDKRGLSVIALKMPPCSTEKHNITLYMIAVGVFLVLLSVIVIVIFIYKRRYRKRAPTMENKSMGTNMRYIVIDQTCHSPLNETYKKQWL